MLQYQTTKPVAQLDLDRLAGGLGVVRDAVEVQGDRDCDMMIDFFARPGVLIDHAGDSAARGLRVSAERLPSQAKTPGSLRVRKCHQTKRKPGGASCESGQEGRPTDSNPADHVTPSADTEATGTARTTVQEFWPAAYSRITYSRPQAAHSRHGARFGY